VADTTHVAQQQRAGACRPVPPFALEGSEIGVTDECGDVEVGPLVQSTFAARSVIDDPDDARVTFRRGEQVPHLG